MTDFYVPTSLEAERETILRELRNGAQLYGVEIDTQPGSADWLFAHAHAQPSLLHYENIALLAPELNPVTCSEGVLKLWCAALKLPEIVPIGASGRIVISTVGESTMPRGQTFFIPSTGARGTVVSTYVGVWDNQEIDVQMDGSGEETNAEAGTQVRFNSPPSNTLEYAKVSSIKPLTGGTSEENVARRRDRVLAKIGYSASGGNPGELIGIATSIPVVQNAYVYSALGGGGTEKVVVCKAFDRKNRNYSRMVPDGALPFVRAALLKEFGRSLKIVTQSVLDEVSDVAVKMALPPSAFVGGNGTGWSDNAPWPPAPSGAGIAIVAAPTSRQITVNSPSMTAPVAGRTNIAWWSPNDKKFYRATVLTFTGGPGAWALNLSVPLVDSWGAAPAIGDWISPVCANLDAYGDAWIDGFEQLGPGENTAIPVLLPRSSRIPLMIDGPRCDVSLSHFKKLREQTEIDRMEIAWANKTSPTLPSGLNQPPNILVPRHFGVYPL